jgi:hypothetical protein
MAARAGRGPALRDLGAAAGAAYAVARRCAGGADDDRRPRDLAIARRRGVELRVLAARPRGRRWLGPGAQHDGEPDADGAARRRVAADETSRPT